MIAISLYHQYTRNIATALGIGYVLAVDDEQVTAQIPDSADPVLVAIIPSDDTADSLTADNMSEASTSLLFIVSPIKADTDTAEFFARHQSITEKCKKLMMLYADAYPSLLGIKENRISSDPITGQFSGNMAGYILSFSLSNPATFYSETVPDIPGIDQPTAYVEIADVVGLLEALAGKATAEHRHATSDIDNLTEILTPLQQDVADIDARVTQAETDIAGKAPVEHRHATSDIDNLTEILDPLQQDVADIDARVTQAETDIAGKAPSMHRHATSEIDNLTEILDPLQQDVADIDARVTQAETAIDATESIVSKYPSTPIASKMLVARADGTGYEHTAFRADQVLQTSAVDVSDPTWLEQEERISTIKKNNGVASFDGSAKLVDNFLPPSVLATLENSDAGWVNETKTLTGDNSKFALGQSGSSGWFSDGSFVQCLTATYNVAGSATFRRNRATDVLNRNDSQDALVINQLDPSYTYPAMTPTGISTDLGWNTLTQTKAINNTTYPARLGTWFIGGVNGTGYRYDCYAIESNLSYWKRSGMPEAVIVRITAASHPTLTGRLVAKSDWATSAYTQQAGDEATYVDGYYYHAASRSMYRKVDFTIWEKIK